MWLKFIEPMLTYSLVCLQPDGHCMYRAVQDQLSLHANDQQQQAATSATSEDDHQTDDVMDLRKKTADYIRNHRDDFLPFLMQVSRFPDLSPKLVGHLAFKKFHLCLHQLPRCANQPYKAGLRHPRYHT